MTKVLFFLILMFGLLISGCGKQSTSSDFMVWELDATSARKMDMTLFVDSIYIVPLETKNDCLIRKVYALAFADGKFYVNNNQTDIQVYDSVGKYLYGTRDYLGSGPNDYASVVSFHVLENDSIEIFDALSYKMRYFSYPDGLVSSYKIPRELLPASQYEWLNENVCVFSSGATQNPTLKIYSKIQNRILKEISDEQKTSFVKTADVLYKVNGELYFSAPYPSNELYKLNDRLDKELVLRLDFGQYNFSIKKLPEGMSPNFYHDYIFTNHKFVYPYSKYILGNVFISFFQFGDNLYVAYKNMKNGKDFVFKNEIGGRFQFLIPHLVQGDEVFYASEPGYLPYLVDEKLMSAVDIEKIKNIGDTDNPVIVAYKLKK